MPTTIRDATWDQIQAIRPRLELGLAAAPHLAHAAQLFAELLAREFSTIALARLFLVAPLARLPAEEQAVATTFANAARRQVPLDPAIPVLSLLGTSGAEPGWNRRTTSAGHRAIPLIDKELVHSAPMIAALLSSLDVDLAKLRGDAPVQLRSLAGGLNARFYVPDARESKDAEQRHIIAARDFVADHDIRTVFGMGGTYVNGMLAVAIVFTRELLDVPHVDRFPSFIGTFKIATAKLVESGSLFAA